MAKIRVLRKQEKAYIELPQEMAGIDEIELFQLRDGYYLLSVPLGRSQPQPTKLNNTTTDNIITNTEKAVLRKLLSIRFRDRTPAYVNKRLSNDELVILKNLEKRKLVNVFKGRKYREGVYNISDKVYPLLSQRTARATSKPHQEEHKRPAVQASSDTMVLALKSHGFVVIPNKREAFKFSEKLGNNMKKGAVIGIKGFDGKFYAVTRNYFIKSKNLINEVLKEEMDAPSIAIATKLDAEGCMAVLRLMAENGEILEKKKGIFAPI